MPFLHASLIIMKNILGLFVLFCLGLGPSKGLLAQNKTHDANAHMNQRPFDELVKEMERGDRSWWQKPDEVISLLRPLRAKKVIDIGCGTGYFSFPLVDSGAVVIAADIDERFLAYVDSVKKARGISDKQLQTRKVLTDDPLLEKREADIVLIVNTYHHLTNRVEYLKKVKAGLKKQGYIIIIDFFEKDLPLGPPKNLKQSADVVVRELKLAGFTQFKTDDKLLQYQYLVFGM
jgi:2-polyprenyl-3-methyl-5-hydroxy-6-metoxy-1,4-benzoquinol methylase